MRERDGDTQTCLREREEITSRIRESIARRANDASHP